MISVVRIASPANPARYRALPREKRPIPGSARSAGRAAIREVVSRRLRRLDKEGESLPDILLIDGGKGQLNAALAAMDAVGVRPPLTISLAKRDEEVYVPGEAEPRRLSKHSYGLRLLQYVRDESHRFAQNYHHILRRKSTFEK